MFFFLFFSYCRLPGPIGSQVVAAQLRRIGRRRRRRDDVYYMCFFFFKFYLCVFLYRVILYKLYTCVVFRPYYYIYVKKRHISRTTSSRENREKKL